MKKRQRLTGIQYDAIDEFLIAYAARHRPVTVRQLFYAVTSANIPGSRKDEKFYSLIQGRVLNLRRKHLLPYAHISDNTRVLRGDEGFSNWGDAAYWLGRSYRKDYWVDHPSRIEIWMEKDGLAGVLSPVTNEFGVQMITSRGFSSETALYQGIQRGARILRSAGNDELVIYTLYDFDQAGRAAAKAVSEGLKRFARVEGISVRSENLALTEYQIYTMGLQTRAPKPNPRNPDPFPFACELDAIPPDELRSMVRDRLAEHLGDHELKNLKIVEASEQAAIRMAIEDAGELRRGS